MDFVEQLKSSVDIVKVVGEYVRLQKVGSTGRYTGLCPFHQEKTPSFGVNQTHQFYKCFGCDAKGDVLNFVMEIEGLTFPEALKMVAERNGIPMPAKTGFSDGQSKLRESLLAMHTLAAEVFQANLRGPQGAEARGYLERRDVSPELIETFGLGYADPSGQALARRLSERGFTSEQVESSGLLRLRGRLIFPIHDESGKAIAFGGRATRDQDQPKYLNSPETPIYHKSSVLYNLHRAKTAMRKVNRAVLVEGYMDVIGAYAAGAGEVVASCGTALTSQQIRAIHRHADTIVVNFDPDAAGSNAAERAIQLLLDEGLHVRVLTLDQGLDPDEYVKRHGAEVYRAKLDAATDYFHWLADRARAKFDMRSADGRMDVFKFLLPAVQKITDKLTRASVASDLASYLGVERGLVLDQFKKAATERQTQHSSMREPGASAPAIERLLLSSLLASGRARAEVAPLLTPQLTQGFSSPEIFDALRQTAGLEGPAAFSALEARLPPSAQTLLHEVLTSDGTGDEISSYEQAHKCLRRLESDAKKRQEDELRTRVKAAEREGRMSEALELIRELYRLEGTRIRRG